MYTTYVPRHRVAKFVKEYGEPEHRSHHKDHVALQYEEIPEGLIEQYGGGWYTWTGRSKGRREAFKQAGRHF